MMQTWLVKENPFSAWNHLTRARGVTWAAVQSRQRLKGTFLNFATADDVPANLAAPGGRGGRDAAADPQQRQDCSDD